MSMLPQWYAAGTFQNQVTCPAKNHCSNMRLLMPHRVCSNTMQQFMFWEEDEQRRSVRVYMQRG